MKKLITSLALVLTALSSYAITPHVFHRMERRLSFVIKAIFTKSPHRVGQPFS